MVEELFHPVPRGKVRSGDTQSMLEEDTKSVELPQRIISRVEDRVKRTEFDTPAEYITFVMEEVLYRVEKETEDEDFEPVDEEEVKDRLKSLGYLNE